MIRAALLLSAVVCFLQPFRASATGQAAERLVVGRDTMQLFALLLATADPPCSPGSKKRLDELDASGSTACWRRCIGVWRLDDEGILWLECVNTEDGDVVFSGAELVPEFAAGSRAPGRLVQRRDPLWHGESGVLPTRWIYAESRTRMGGCGVRGAREGDESLPEPAV